MTIQNWVPSIANLRRVNRAVTFFRPKGGCFFFFANTPDMQYFKGKFPPIFRVPLKQGCSKLLRPEGQIYSHVWYEGHLPP